jgi:hypothetical protein
VKVSLDSLRAFLLKRKVELKNSIARKSKHTESIFMQTASIAVNNYSLCHQLTIEAISTNVVASVNQIYKDTASAFRCLADFGILALREIEPEVR